MPEQERNTYQLILEQFKYLSVKIKQVTSNVAITEKNEKRYVRQIIQLSTPGTQGEFSDKVTPDVMVLLMNH